MFTNTAEPTFQEATSNYDLLTIVQRMSEEEQQIQASPKDLTQHLANRLNPACRIVQALEHAERHQRWNGQNEQLGLTLWPYMPFAMSVETLLMAALVGCAPHEPRSQSWALFHALTDEQRDRFQQALHHVETYDQANDSLWPYQSFTLTFGELLRSALKR